MFRRQNLTTRMGNYDFSDPETAKSLDALQNKFEVESNSNSAEGNETERSLSGQLILLTTVLITVNILVLSNDSIVKHITHLQKVYVFWALVSEAIATFAGIMNYVRLENSYNRWAGVWRNCAEIVKGRKYKTPEELDGKISAEQSRIQDRDRPELWVQIGAIGISIILYLFLLYSFLFVK